MEQIILQTMLGWFYLTLTKVEEKFYEGVWGCSYIITREYHIPRKLRRSLGLSKSDDRIILTKERRNCRDHSHWHIPSWIYSGGVDGCIIRFNFQATKETSFKMRRKNLPSVYEEDYVLPMKSNHLFAEATGGEWGKIGYSHYGKKATLRDYRRGTNLSKKCLHPCMGGESGDRFD